MICHILGNQSRSYQFLCMLIWNLKTKFIFHSHDHLHMVETVKTKIIDKMTVQSQLVGSDFVKSFTNIQNSALNFFLAESRSKSFDWKISPSRMLWSKFKIQTLIIIVDGVHQFNCTNFGSSLNQRTLSNTEELANKNPTSK